MAGTGLPVQVVSCGVPFLFVPSRRGRAVDSATLNPRGVRRADAARCRREANGVFFFSPERGTDKATVYSRMFAPGVGVVEDPATGIASGPLGCYLVRHKVVAAGAARLDAEPAGREDGPPEPGAYVDRRRRRRDPQRARRRRGGARR